MKDEKEQYKRFGELKPMENIDLIEKVKTALLAMQRFSWEQGVTAQAFLELGEDDWVILLARAAVMRQLDSKLAAFSANATATDPASNGEPVLYAAKITGDPLFTEAAQKMLDCLLNATHKNNDGIFYHAPDAKQIWVDALYMVPPFLAAAGHIDEAIRQIRGFRKVLWNPKDRLYSHYWDDDVKAFGRKDYWGVGNGWAAAGLTRVIRLLPETRVEERREIITYVREVIDGCLAHVRDDGLFHYIVDDQSTFVETNLAQMISYSIYRGVAGGWLSDSFLQPAKILRKASHKMVDRYGLVQGVCGCPRFDHPGIAPEGQAFFLLMEAAANEVE